MEQGSNQDVLKHTLIRMLAAAAVTAAFGFLFFQSRIFDMKMVASQFVESGITAAIFYAFLRTLRMRDGLVAILVWYVVLTFLVVPFNSWLPILFGAYVAGIAAAVYVYWVFVRREIVRGAVQRVAAAGVLVAISNAVIIVVLGLFSGRVIFSSPGFFASTVFKNLQLGTLIGIGFGVGAELAEYIIRRTGEPTAPAER